MSGYDITDELRINWDENQNPPVPFFCASFGEAAGGVTDAVRQRMAQYRRVANDMERWLDAYKALPEDARLDSVHGGPAKKETRERKT